MPGAQTCQFARYMQARRNHAREELIEAPEDTGIAQIPMAAAALQPLDSKAQRNGEKDEAH